MKKTAKKLLKKTALLALTSSLLFSLWGCSEKEPIDCPYSDLGWETTEDELFAAEGDYVSSYDSTYGGLTYTYEGSYKDRDGVLKYMYDEEGVLMSIAFTYSSTSDEDLQEFYDELHSELVDTYGESGNKDTSNSTNYGDVWRMDEGHIILSVMITDSNKALQIAYVNPANQE